jgi:hypothetical protein
MVERIAPLMSEGSPPVTRLITLRIASGRENVALSIVPSASVRRSKRSKL